MGSYQPQGDDFSPSTNQARPLKQRPINDGSPLPKRSARPSEVRIDALRRGTRTSRPGSMTTSSATRKSSRGWPPPSSHEAGLARRPVPRPGRLPVPGRSSPRRGAGGVARHHRPGPGSRRSRAGRNLRRGRAVPGPGHQGPRAGRPPRQEPPAARWQKARRLPLPLEFLARNGRRFIATNVDGTIDMMVRIAGARSTQPRSRRGSGARSADVCPLEPRRLPGQGSGAAPRSPVPAAAAARCRADPDDSVSRERAQSAIRNRLMSRTLRRTTVPGQ